MGVSGSRAFGEGRIGNGTPCAPAAGGAFSMETVLQLVQRSSGSVLDADAPLMDAGLDSLGATELRGRLEQEVGGGIELPATLVFEASTVRLISERLSGGRLGVWRKGEPPRERAFREEGYDRSAFREETVTALFCFTTPLRP